jgi:glycosyltransferase involved in cell wall biosynthesis
MRKVLLLTYHFPPSAASGMFRILGWARHLPRFGWQPVVVAPPRLPWEPVDERLVAQVPLDTSVYRAPYPRSRANKVLRYFFPNAVWLRHACRACLEAVAAHRPAALITSSPPHCVHLLGLHLHRHCRLPWVADFRDPWLVDGRPTSPTAWLPWLDRLGERLVLAHADRIVANTPNCCAALAQTYSLHAEKICSITNGFDPEAFPAAPPPPGSGSALHVVHAGELHFGRDPRPFLDALQAMLSVSALSARCLRARFLGQTNCAGLDLNDEIRRRGLADAVDLPGQMPYQKTLQELTAADILLVLDTPGRSIGVPAKVYEYLGAGRPILALAEPGGDTDLVLKQSGVLHRVAPPRDMERIGQALVELIREIMRPVGPGGPEPNLLAFARLHTARQLATILDSITPPMALPTADSPSEALAVAGATG